MEKQSITITGLLIALVSLILQKFGVNVTNEEVGGLILNILQNLGILLAWYGRWRKGDINLIGKKKK